MNQEIEKLNPPEDLKVEQQTLSGFIEKISSRYFNEEVAVSAEDMQRISEDLAAEFRFFTDDEIRQIKEGIAVL